MRINPRLPFILCLALLVSLPSALAKDDFKFGGRIGLGFAVDEEDGTDDVFELRVAMKSRRKDGLKAYVELKGEDGTRDISVHDAFVDYRPESKASRVRFGRGKKIMGWEYEYSTGQRLSISRSAAYSYLSKRSIVGRDYFVSYDWYDRAEAEADSEAGENPKAESGDLDSAPGKPGNLISESERWKLGVAAHYDESKDIGFIVNAIASVSEHFRVGTWLARQWTRTEHNGIHTHQATISGLGEFGIHRTAIEAFAGEDPFRTIAERKIGGGRTIRYGALKAEYGLMYGHWNPYVIVTRILRDLQHGGDRTTEGTVGLRLYLTERLNVAGEMMAQTSRSSFDATTMPYDRSSAALLARYYF